MSTVTTVMKEFKIYRWDPTSKGKPYMSTYLINLNEYGHLIAILTLVEVG